MIFLKAYYCISREPFKMSREEIWLDGSKIQSIEPSPINGVYGDHSEFLCGCALVAVRSTGAEFILGIFNKHKCGRIANCADAYQAQRELKKLLEGNYHPKTDCGFEYRIV